MSVPAPRPEAASNPHDAYTQSVFRELPQARGFFRGYLPDEVRELFDWRTLRLETGNFLSDELQRDFADLRFSIRFAGQQRAHRITLLFEHKHRVIYTTPRQLHRYISRQLEETPDGQPLPSILTVVLLQSGTWNRSRTLSSEYDLPEAARGILAPYLVDFQMVMAAGRVPRISARTSSPRASARVILFVECDRGEPGGRSAAGASVGPGRIPAGQGQCNDTAGASTANK